MNRLSLIALGCSLLACLLLWHLWQDASERAEEAELTVARLRQANEAALSALELRDQLSGKAGRKKEENDHVLDYLEQGDGLSVDQRWTELDELLRLLAPYCRATTGKPDTGQSCSAVPCTGVRGDQGVRD